MSFAIAAIPFEAAQPLNISSRICWLRQGREDSGADQTAPEQGMAGRQTDRLADKQVYIDRQADRLID